MPGDIDLLIISNAVATQTENAAEEPRPEAILWSDLISKEKPVISELVEIAFERRKRKTEIEFDIL